MPPNHVVCLTASLLLGASLSASPLFAQSRISGVVLHGRTAKPVVDATVRIAALGLERITDTQGRFVFPLLDDYLVVLETQHIAFAARSDTVRLTSAEHTRLEIRMMENAIELQPLTVEVRSRRLEETGFFSRKEKGVGFFFTRSEIQAQRTDRLGDVLSRVPGLRRVLTSDGDSRINTRGSGRWLSSRCDTQYFIDGVPIQSAVIVDAIPIHAIEGVEVYRGASEVPTQFDRGRAACGAVMIWTTGG